MRCLKYQQKSSGMQSNLSYLELSCNENMKIVNNERILPEGIRKDGKTLYYGSRNLY